MTASSNDKAFEIFVKGAVDRIQKEAWGRGKDTELRATCSSFLATLEQHEAGVAFDGSLAVLVLQTLSMACASSNPKVVELALGCLHKLVSHAWLYGESSLFESLIDDGSDVVTQVIRMVVKCGEMPGEGLQLQVVQALLTFTTAEHFVAHGDCLMAAVRTVFNLALGSDSETIKRTAGSALLQMLNTIVKRITANLHHVGDLSYGSSLRVSDSGEHAHDHNHNHNHNQHHSAADTPLRGTAAPHPAADSVANGGGAAAYQLERRRTGDAYAVDTAGSGGGGATAIGDSGAPAPSIAQSGPPGELASDARTAQVGTSQASERASRGMPGVT